jgi:uncharacterized membrane protein (UPF0127 family)
LILRSLLALLLLGLAFPGVRPLPAGAAAALEELVILTGKGRTTFEVEVADTDAERSKGLMYRGSMPQNHGMLFDFGTPRPVAMWMKNTKIPLDMVFADAQGQVIAIREDTVPFSTATIEVDEQVKAVLEVNAGTAKRVGLAVGDRLLHRIFAKG